MIRVRTSRDVPACVAVAKEVHDTDGYPRFLPGDFESFLVAPDTMNAWVAVDERSVVGQVSLHRSTTREAMECASAFAGVGPESLAVVARLMVAPASRGLRIGQSLLTTSAEHARELGFTPMLDVVTSSHHAIELYERCGWSRAGEVCSTLSNGATLDEFVYLCP